MFTSTHPFLFFDVMRIPYAVVPTPDASGATLGRIRLTRPVDPTRDLLWVRAAARTGAPRHRGTFRLGGFEVAGVVEDIRPERLGLGADRGWKVRERVLDADGHPVGTVWIDRAGSVLLPFDPGAVMTGLWSEEYTSLGVLDSARRHLRTIAVHGYYELRPLIPRAMQLWLRRVFARTRAAPAYPAWPLEHGLHDLYDWLLGVTAAVAGTAVPWLHPWPDGAEWAMVLTHDVETDQGCRDIELLRGPERDRGYRSSWNFVPERYDVAAGVLAQLGAEDCEVGVHGLRHDGKDVRSRRMLDRRIPAMREAAGRWAAVGFRSPATQRRWDLMPRLPFAYDSSYTDTEPYEPQPGGCCTYWPFFNDSLVELPITIPQDHTLFEILGHRDGTVWLDKGRALRSRHGMLLALSHPDYAHGLAAGAWQALLDEFADDDTKWQALPREVAEWWRARADSEPELCEGTWRVRGPAEGRARVCLTRGEHAPVWS